MRGSIQLEVQYEFAASSRYDQQLETVLVVHYIRIPIARHKQNLWDSVKV
jgi:hypothetical protein